MKAFVLFLLVVPTSCLAQSADDLPDGSGKEVVTSICQQCHGLDVVAAQRDTKEGWTATVNTMRSRGASGSDKDFAAIIDYLATYLGSAPSKLRINTAMSKDIASVLGLTSSEADLIVAYRKDHGDFKDWDSLTKVNGVDFKKAEAKKDQIAFDSSQGDEKH